MFYLGGSTSFPDRDRESEPVNLGTTWYVNWGYILLGSGTGNSESSKFVRRWYFSFDMFSSYPDRDRTSETVISRSHVVPLLNSLIFL